MPRFKVRYSYLPQQFAQVDDLFELPAERAETFDTFHTFVIQVDRRDELRAHLAGRGIETFIHYPVPIHLQPAAASLGYRAGDFPVAENQAKRILSLPVHQFLRRDQVEEVAATVNAFLHA